MSEDYLWDGSGEQDVEVAKLEEQLRPLRWAGAPISTNRQKSAKRTSFPYWAIAALVCLCTGAAFLYGRFASRTSWTVAVGGAKAAAVRTGQVIETSHALKATLQAESIGSVAMETDTRIHITEASRRGERFRLDHGTIHALIWAPPAKFVVDTPSAVAVDLGCQYTLSVAKDGSGFLSVESGWVAFEARGIESFIPADAACTTRRGQGPDTPRFIDAKPELIAALTLFDVEAKDEALDAVLAAARPRDGLTLWHLLKRTKGGQRDRVYSRLAQLVELPETASRAAILEGDMPAFDAAWNALQLGDTNWWREWKRRW